MKTQWLYGLCLASSLYITDVLAIRPWEMTWSPQKFGPDGPWNAVSVGVGSNDARIALYPGATWTSEILLSSLCENSTVSSYCYGDQGGLFDPAQSTTYDNTSIALGPNGWSSIAYGSTNAVPINADAKRALDLVDVGGQTVPTVDLITIKQGYQVYPGGKAFPLHLGVLSLGSPDPNQTFSLGYGRDPINGTFVTSWLHDNGVIPSYSYGMHIGSATLNIPPSLHLGGYDKSRVIGDVSSQPVKGGSCPIQLIDISLGVGNGGSPWNTSSTTGLLAQGNSSMASGLMVDVDPADPYIFLPKSSCDAIAARLPVTYDAELGLYFWNTASSLYKQITTSPSFMAFTFLKNGVNTAQFSVKVPFALLNLTLQAPLVAQPTPYFPCMGTDSQPVLGRAFLQAAFIGVHWADARWFLAQAPGPDASFIQNVIALSAKSASVESSGNSWEGTWSKFWTPLSSASPSNTTATSIPSATTSSSTTATAHGNGLSTAVKAGIGAAAGVVGLLIIAGACWFLFHRKRTEKSSTIDGEVTYVPPKPRLVQAEPWEVGDTRPSQLHELENDRRSEYTWTSTQTSHNGRTRPTNSVNGHSVHNPSEVSGDVQHGPYELGGR
ncbi:Uncharacterized protein PECH_001589 [Penicillium ucsense]|uniref:Peptidase A1 domain-containing protein n=1 Tax=Penicillium ucsense TaxID=2839758 RepID=A0A8J8WHM8_9EURO|nr:Uncharacterized protein PECM_001400 [Penicillium ucsense]KAF7732618.1 Uncharacterized protein PECH_001589 [Penicillium ucsense]